jgi:Ca2+-binding EF-hand superfamily protein
LLAALSGVDIEELFDEWDKDGSGKISHDELRTGLKKLGTDDSVSKRVLSDSKIEMAKQLSDRAIDGIIKAVDKNNDGEVNFFELKKLASGKVEDEKLQGYIQKAAYSGKAPHKLHTPHTPHTAPPLCFLCAPSLSCVVLGGCRMSVGVKKVVRYMEEARQERAQSMTASGAQRAGASTEETATESLKRMFIEWDNDGSGVLSAEEFRRGINEICEATGHTKLSSHEVKNIIKVFDRDGGRC